MKSVVLFAMFALVGSILAPNSDAGCFGKLFGRHNACAPACAPEPTCCPEPAPAPVCCPEPAPVCCPEPAPAPVCCPEPAPVCCPEPAPVCCPEPAPTCCEPAAKCGLFSKLRAKLQAKRACCAPAPCGC